MTQQTSTGLLGLMLIFGLSACGGPSPTAPAETRSYRVLQHDMMPQQPTDATQQHDPDELMPRHRPRGRSAFIRGVPFIPETYPVPRRDWNMPLLRGESFLPGAYNRRYPRPEAERLRARQLDYARVRLTAVEQRIEALQLARRQVSNPSTLGRILTELDALRAERERLRDMLRGSIYRVDN